MTNPENKNIKIALKVWGKIIVSCIMCAIVYLSLYILGSGLLSKSVGYRIFQTDENGNNILVEEHYYSSPADSNSDLALPEGASDQQVVEIKEMSATTTTWLEIITQLIMLILLGVFPYGTLWDLGSRDENQVLYGHRQRDAWRGTKIGLLATIPAAVLYLGLWIGKLGLLPDWYLSVYRIVSISYLPYINAFISKEILTASAISCLDMLGIAVTLLYIPAICAIGYALGYKGISINEKVTYKKK